MAAVLIGISLRGGGVLAAAEEATATAEARPADKVSCVTGSCHSSFGRKKFTHRPSAEKDCGSCHAPTTPVSTAPPPAGKCVAEWKLARPEAELCSSCHALVSKNFVHKPVAEGKCLGCHDPHESDHVHVLTEDPTAKLCLTCHQDDRYAPAEAGHEPARSGACILCHETHSSWNRSLLVRTGSSLCFTCHEDVRTELADRRHAHEPVLKDCGLCHDPHGSGHAGQLTKQVKDLCLDCHHEIKALVEASDRVHGALESERSCLSCHAAHASDLPRLVDRPLLDGCLQCHDEPVKGRDGQMLANMAEVLRDNPDHHGPVRRADCASCHDPHASRNFRRLTHIYPKGFYLQEFDIESYDLCFQCHFKELVLVPEGPGITRFQHGRTNLHYSHVNREKSRTCRACHAVHASKNPAHMVDTFVFGEWKDAPLGFEKLPTGGTCAPACHKKVTYERGSKEPVPVVK